MASEILTSHFKVKKSKDDIGKSVPGSEVDNNSAGPSKRISDFDLLRDFDMEWKYGPCIGLSRLERWERADKHGLNPPEEIRCLIMKHISDDTYTQCVWNDYKVL